MEVKQAAGISLSHFTKIMPKTTQPLLFTTQLLATNAVPVFPWPSSSPDLKPIEYAWDVIKRKLIVWVSLVQKIIAAWSTFNPEVMTNIIQSMRRRMILCIANRGGHTLHTLQRNITHLAIITRKTNIKLGILKGGTGKEPKRAVNACKMKINRLVSLKIFNF